MQESRAALLVVVTGTLMAAVDSTIMILALPTVGQALDSNLSTIIWAILIYFLLTAVLTTQMGRIGDIFGRSRFYLRLGFEKIAPAESARRGFWINAAVAQSLGIPL